MSHRLHLALMLAGEFAGFIAGAVVASWIWVARPFAMSLPVAAVVLGALVLSCVMVPRILFRRLIPACCPTGECGGAAYPEGRKPIVYRCRRCGHVLDTGWSDATSHAHHRP